MGEVLGQRASLIWHTETDLSDYDLVILPGGFSMEITCGRARSPGSPRAMSALKRYAAEGGWVLGICNGFQVLAESHLLPGALMRNGKLAFSCRWVHVRVEE